MTNQEIIQTIINRLQELQRYDVEIGKWDKEDDWETIIPKKDPNGEWIQQDDIKYLLDDIQELLKPKN